MEYFTPKPRISKTEMHNVARSASDLVSPPPTTLSRPLFILTSMFNIVVSLIYCLGFESSKPKQRLHMLDHLGGICVGLERGESVPWPEVWPTYLLVCLGFPHLPRRVKHDLLQGGISPWFVVFH